MNALERHEGFPIDDPAELGGLAPQGPGLDPVVMALINHQRHKPDKCLCGWGELGHLHAEHVADIIRPLIEVQALESAEREVVGLIRTVVPFRPDFDARSMEWILHNAVAKIQAAKIRVLES